MAIYVDPLNDWGWKLRGHKVSSCHMFTDSLDLEELHTMAEKIGMKKEWFQTHKVVHHYDLTKSRRDLAISLGAKEVSWKEASLIWKKRRMIIIC